MTTNFFTTARIAGILLLLSVLILLGGVGFIAAQGRLEGMGVAFRGVGVAHRDAYGLRILTGLTIPSLMAQLAGFTLFALLLYQAGDRGLAFVALALLVFGMVLAVIEASFHASVTVWAANLRSAPEFYEPLRRWVNGSVQITYVSFMLTALLLFSVSALRERVIPSPIGWVALALSLLSFWHYFFVLGAPAVIFAPLLLFGAGLVWRG